jgi:uncharacterized protein YggT (Ycf19 family)
LVRAASVAVRARAKATAIVIRVSVIAAAVTWLVAIQVVSGWLNQRWEPIEKALRAVMIAIPSAA